MVDYSETIEVYHLKVGTYSKLNEYIEINVYWRSRPFFDFCPRSLRMKLDPGPLVLLYHISSYIE